MLVYKPVQQTRLKRCNQQLKVPVNLYCSCIFLRHECTDRTTDRQIDRQTDQVHELHVYVGLAQARPNHYFQ